MGFDAFDADADDVDAEFLEFGIEVAEVLNLLRVRVAAVLEIEEQDQRFADQFVQPTMAYCPLVEGSVNGLKRSPTFNGGCSSGMAKILNDLYRSFRKRLVASHTVLTSASLNEGNIGRLRMRLT